MKSIILVLVLAFVLSTTAMASDIALYVGGWNPGWYDASQFDHVNTIIAESGHMFKDVQQFDDSQAGFDAFTAWIEANTDDGEMDIIWLNGTMPSVLYQFPNVDADGSPAEVWFDNGNMMINVGDWFGYMSYEGGSRSADNGPNGAANILDLAGGIFVGGGQGTMEITSAGREFLPSLTAVSSDRPLVLSQVVAPWEVAEIFAQNSAGTHADPIVIHNTETNGYLAIVNQNAGGGWLDDRGLTTAELINNWIGPIVGLGDPALAAPLNPDDEVIDVSRDIELTWAAGESAATHNVYFGAAFEDVNTGTGDVMVSMGQADTSFDPGRLTLGQTYFWRIDEVNGAPDNTVFKGEVWSFEVEPVGYPIANITATASSSFGASGPEKTIDGSGLADDLHGVGASDMWISGAIPATIEYAFDRAYKLHELWIWNSNQLIESFVGFGAKDVVIEHSLDGENWTVLDGVGPLARATGTPGDPHNNTIDFGGAMAQHVRVTVNSVQGIAPQASLSEVRFFFIPTFATRPSPASGATDVAPDTSLAWGRDGREADRHEVLLGTDADNLASVATVNESSLDTLALDLQLAQGYSWRVDEVNDVMDPSTWEGTVWSFTTADTIPIDDMERYKDEEFFEIWATWVDGFDDPANGSLVGNGAAGSPETGIVHGGRQSLPMDYGIGGAALSESTRTFDAPMDWTGHGVQGLVLYFQGSSDNTGGALYVKINGAKVAYDGDAAALMSFGWSKWYIPLSEVTGTDLSRVTALTIGVDNGGTGVVYIDSIVLTGAARDLVTPADPGTAGLLAHYPLDGDYQDASGNGLNGAAVGSPVFENDPARGQVMRLNGLDSAVDLGASDVFNFPGSFSLSVWANITGFNSNWGHALIGKRGENGVGWQLRRHSGNPNLTFTTRGTTGADDPQGAIDISTAFGQWVHVAAVYDMEAGQRTVYVNGVVDVSIDDSGTVATATQNTYIGARATSDNSGQEAFFSGALDEVRVYGRALSLEEVASLAGRTVPFDRP